MKGTLRAEHSALSAVSELFFIGFSWHSDGLQVKFLTDSNQTYIWRMRGKCEARNFDKIAPIEAKVQRNGSLFSK
jgi:hypothetical protein